MEAYTVGVEEEYQLVDPATGALVSRACDVLAIDWTDETGHELQETQLEMATGVCGSATELDAELRRLRLHAAAAAGARDLVPVAAGLHPFSLWQAHEHTDTDRYRRLIEHYGRVMETEHVFGMHVHVAVPPDVDRMAAIGRLRPWLPHLTALAASSPFFEGGDTGYDSYRSILNQRLPCSGPPPALRTEAEYRAYTAGLVEQGVAIDEASIYWTARPHHRYPTIELRCTDVCPRVEDAVAIAALARALVAAAGEGALLEDGPAGASAAPPAAAALVANEWTAARFGLRGLARRVDGRVEPLADGVRRLRDAVAPLAERLGDAAALEGLDVVLDRGNGATRMREVAGGDADLRPLVAWLAAETALGTGLDRPQPQGDAR